MRNRMVPQRVTLDKSRPPGEMSKTTRMGISRWDVVAIIVIGGLVIASLLPTVRTAGGAARRLECLNNMKYIALATHNYASGAGGQLPLLEDGRFGWPIALTPALDNTALYIHFTAKPDEPESQIWVRVFTCPDDTNNHRQPMGLSYAANTGYGNFRVDQSTGAINEVSTHTADIDWNGDGIFDDGDRNVSRATGVFWRGHEDGFRMSLDAIEQGDGLSQTILFAENVNARNWASRKTMDIAFVVGRDVLGLNGRTNGGRSLRIQSESLGAFHINSNDGSLPGQSPVASSSHEGMVNIAFCDGRATAMSESIDPRVYARLVTPDGETFGQLKVGDGDY